MGWVGEGIHLFLEVMPHTTRSSARIRRGTKKGRKVKWVLDSGAPFWNWGSWSWHDLPWGKEREAWAASDSHANIDLGDRNIPEPHNLIGVPVSQRRIVFTLCQLPVLLMSWIYILNRNAGFLKKNLSERSICCIPAVCWVLRLGFFSHYYFKERRWFCNLNHKQINYHSWLVHLRTLLSIWS